MNRRDFLRIMLASAGAATYDYEKLLWIPQPFITVPARDEWEPIRINGIFRAIDDGGMFNFFDEDKVTYNAKLQQFRHYGLTFVRNGPISYREINATIK